MTRYLPCGMGCARAPYKTHLKFCLKEFYLIRGLGAGGKSWLRWLVQAYAMEQNRADSSQLMFSFTSHPLDQGNISQQNVLVKLFLYKDFI